jgi:glucose-6-phosphate 1-dehydrogenase
LRRGSLTPEEVLTKAMRGQYGPGTLLDSPVPAYRSEPQVTPRSATETFVAMELHINRRWAGVPFYLRTGKRLVQRVTEIAIQFKRAPQLLFRGTEVERLSAYQLVMHIQPDEGISLQGIPPYRKLWNHRGPAHGRIDSRKQAREVLPSISEHML